MEILRERLENQKKENDIGEREREIAKRDIVRLRERKMIAIM